MLWVVDHLDDLDADFRAFYRIDDMEQLDSVRFLRLAYRTYAYGGVMAARQQHAEQEERRRTGGPDSGSYGADPGRDEVRRVESTGANLAAIDGDMEYARVEVA